ncbi:MAG: tRNA threonylcarbamoyladenosine biosynthesis protein TsaB [Pseudonocardiales bacterium]|nr:tRNA threonylcarbamoyladenosine biosynthesis protein TsaB [Pseudonocardiales bacterium]
MLVLAIDTSSAAVSAALVDVSGGPGAPTAERAARVHVNARAHGELLAPAIAGCLHDAGAVPRDLGALVAGVGPGPYTGLRVGLVTAAVMADALGIPTYGVCSLDAVAAGVVHEGELLVMTDAKRKEVYWARYAGAGDRIAGPEVDRPQDVPAGGVDEIAGAGARLYADAFPGRRLLGADYPHPARLVPWALDRIVSGAPSDALTPLYLRRPDAVVPAAPKAVSR